jgi:hypothetical protein
MTKEMAGYPGRSQWLGSLPDVENMKVETT